MRVLKPLISSFVYLLLVGLMSAAFTSTTALAQEQQEQQIKDTPNNKAKIAFKEAAEAVQNKDYETARDKFLESEKFAQKADNQQLAQKAHNNAIKIQYNLGKLQLQQGNFDAAIAAYERGIEFAPDYPNNYFMKGYALKQQGNADEAIEWYQQAIDVAQEQGNTAIVSKANNNIAGIWLARAGTAFDNENYEEGLGYLDRATEFIEPDASMYYQYARGHNGLRNYEQALSYAQQGLEIVNRNNKQDLSNLYYEKGVAHKNLGQKEQAITAFKQVTAGPYQQNAQYELEHNLSS